jgi:glutaredoxin
MEKEAVYTTMLQVTLYSKAGCHLCDEARAHLEELAATHEIVIEEVDIRRDTSLFERYRHRIPVILIDGTERLEGQIEASQIYELVAPSGGD